MKQRDYKRIRRELLVGMRQSQSQTQINRRLGASFNKLAKWERGHCNIYWNDFVAFAKACRSGAGLRDLRKALCKSLGYYEEVHDSASLVGHLIQGTSRFEAAEYLGISQSKLSKLFSGSCSPRLDEILALIDKKGELPFFLLNLIDLEQAPELKKLLGNQKSLLSLISEFPEILILGELIHVGHFTSDRIPPTEWATRLGLCPIRCQQAFNAMVASGLVSVLNGEISLTDQSLSINTGGSSPEDYEKSLRIKRFWMEKALELSKLPPERRKKSRFGYTTFVCSEETQNKVAQKMVQAYFEIQNLVKEDTGPRNCVVVYSAQLLDLYTD